MSKVLLTYRRKRMEELTLGQKNAIESAKNHLDSQYGCYSRDDLIEELSDEEHGDAFEEDEAVFAVDYLEKNNLVDWKEQAVIRAKRLLDADPLSKKKLIEELVDCHMFTEEEAEYAAKEVGFE